jgi:hypothetical protein
MTATDQKTSERVAIIDAVRTYLGFFVLLVLVVEATLGTLAARVGEQNQLFVLYGMLSIVLVFVIVVSFFAYKKPDALLRSSALPRSERPESGEQLQKFCNDISGYWWERIKPDEPSALSFVEISPYPATGTVKMIGRTYSRLGEASADWDTAASCVNVNERKVFYYWRGWHPSRPNEPYEGFGEISFRGANDQVDSGVGFFSDTNITDMKSTTKKAVEFRRSSEREVKLMKQNDSVTGDLIKERLRSAV